MRSVLVALALLLAAPTAAQTRADASVAASRARAEKLAAAKKWDAAIHAIQEARGIVRTARRKDQTGVPAVKPSPEYRRALQALEQRIRARAAEKPRDRAHLDALKVEYLTEKQKLDRKHGMDRAGQTANWQAAETRVMARYDLLDADLANQEAEYQKARGRAERAAQLREEAAVRRLGAYRALQQRAEALKTARALLALPAREVTTIQPVGDFFQQAGHHAEAATAWRRGITLLGDKANAAERRRLLPLFYRQLAFCCSQQGQDAEARQALARARAAEGS